MSSENNLRVKAMIHVSKCRVVTFQISGVDEGRAQDILEKAKRQSIVTEYGTDEGYAWFQGPPGAALRHVKELLLREGGRSLADDVGAGWTL